ncbi:MAG: type II secretion system GspH family protein [Candidatus Nomurabacteria bacterium]|jgi:type II secretory pathway pseudopilin PulG|nr:type II secretion system GspH family protein [Candidatus Nomurabacteria bacterium]
MMKFKKGDTIVEVTLAITIFSMVAIGGVTLMNMGVNTAQASLQLVMAREALDAQAEALRMIHNAYVASSGSPEANSIASHWVKIVGKVVSTVPKFGSGGQTCQQVIDKSTGRFVIDTRSLRNGSSVNPINTTIKNPTTFPRLVYGYAADSNEVAKDTGTLQGAEGLWVQAVPSVKDPVYNSNLAYDFHIRACWSAPGKTAPSTIGTIIRLYSPIDASASTSGDEPAECLEL